MTRTVVLKFETDSLADANRWADSLKRDLLDAAPDLVIERQRDRETTQDFGATLVLVLGAPAVVVLAKAIHAWAIRNNAGTISLQGPEGTLIAKNIESKNAAAIVEAFRRVHSDAGH